MSRQTYTFEDVAQILSPYIDRDTFTWAYQVMNRLPLRAWRLYAELCRRADSGPWADWSPAETHGAEPPTCVVSNPELRWLLDVSRPTVTNDVINLERHRVLDVDHGPIVLGKARVKRYTVLPMSVWVQSDAVR